MALRQARPLLLGVARLVVPGLTEHGQREVKHRLRQAEDPVPAPQPQPLGLDGEHRGDRETQFPAQHALGVLGGPRVQLLRAGVVTQMPGAVVRERDEAPQVFLLGQFITGMVTSPSSPRSRPSVS